ncbi:unnamed protein product [Brugia pahangi]|uniref:DUF4258 domain-containing protein n=1 Tax=Brugia pahangi TaxID=6280 RepID=A0A0N4SYN6_BRUPA|nr:unnamed protein product [Brugia pahangi]
MIKTESGIVSVSAAKDRAESYLSQSGTVNIADSQRERVIVDDHNTSATVQCHHNHVTVIAMTYQTDSLNVSVVRFDPIDNVVVAIFTEFSTFVEISRELFNP